ncbi:Wzz/FepE/Etk N-terminal domain-containing protein [Mesorhizobium sp. VK9D]|uniref:polysaccharide biosynthesis tyrosine autokinase n=1 Tax=Mesorhizobium australafricanum TaxID=3072311 RepID=UPI002A23F714|nr:Wzz/FepE/Etk N-terminal domain-containing protein [Mesorhizobium sp. VK9D]MDX8457089.1 Wzz/FepE/Etk N-terminal domain-containing protein [Mesorhizobium sp. VK9D]
MQLMHSTGHTTGPMPFEPDVENERQDNHATIVPELGFQQMIGILRRRSTFILTVAALGTILAGVAGLLITPKYTATAQVLVRAATPLSPEALQQAVDTQVTMLTSPFHLQHVLDSLRKDTGFRGATSEPEANSGATAQAPAAPSTTEAGPLSLKELKRRLDVWIGALTGHKRDGTGLTFDDLQRRLQVLQERRSRVIDVTFQWTTPQKAADIVNRTVQLYVQNSAEQQRAYSTNEMARLEERISAVKADIERANAALREASQPRSGASRIAGSEEQVADPDPHELERSAATSAQLYENLLQRQKDIREQDELVSPDASILSLASPPSRPSSPNPILFMLPALIASLICASLLALALERLDRGLRSEREINDALGLSCIGLVPRIPRQHLPLLGRYLRAKPFSPYAEALWSVVATLRMAKPGNAKVVLITSSIPGEGKTKLAQSLAAYIGFLGRSVLLVSLDFRKGSRVGESNDASDRRIVDLSPQSRPPAELIRHIAEAGFDYLPMTGYHLDPLAATEQMAGLIRQLRERYDYVIIDGPSVLGAVEARLLPSIADRLLLVVKWGSTRREVAQNALSLLHKSGGLDKDHSDLAMAIVTQVDLKRHARYRYGDVGEFSSGPGRSR